MTALRKSDSQLDAEAAANSAVRASLAEQTRYSPMVGRNQYSGVSLQDRFWEKVDRRSPDECWPWLAFRHYKGYGEFGGGRSSRQKAHRVAWLLWNGPIPDGLHVLHHCDNPSCCNPSHLWIGTNQDNVDDKMAKGRLRPSLGEKNGAAKLTADQVREIRRLYAERKYPTQRQLGQAFGVSQPVVSAIVLRQKWKSVE